VIKLHVVQAEYGDCFILEFNQGNDTVTVLIDGGPYQTFEKHLKPTLQKLPLNGILDLIILSHIDNDHIIGLLDLLEEIKTERETGIKEFIKIGKLWHNSLNDLFQLDVEPKTLFKNIFLSQNFISREQIEMKKNIVTSIIMKGFQQGTDLALLAKSLKIRINPGFKNLIAVNDAVKLFHLKNITFHLLGPTKKNLDKLKEEWKDWHHGKKQIQNSEFELLQILDKSIPNLASIVFLAQIKNRMILFTGDCLGRDIIEVLSKNAMLDKQGKFHVDILKVPHHGSDRNTSIEFFNIIHADYYIISANGRDDNPSFNTLKWIIESSRNDNNTKKIIFTNWTPNVLKILNEYDQKKFNYKTIILKTKEYFFTIAL
jgi:beta-lactamase superfamily II metal-dependent hydrolase